ncbi:hypothetical protein SBRCBS47491_002757 [Sporothrix bragantina]|uniref:CID domain-containing protein n=1 Tax=Sporothrix bragantina TaxID=671064 RepID=A0ABP0B9U0_9PEZI
MADPFEVRVRFSAQLQNLNASATSAQKAAAYALKYKDMEEDLHSCIIEQLEKPQTALNKRANIMYFIEHFLEMAQREGSNDYAGMIQRDIIRVVDAVAPESGQGAANVKVVRRVLQGMQQKGFLEAQAVTEIEEVLKERETDLLSPDNGERGSGGVDDAGSADGGADMRGGDPMAVDGQSQAQAHSSRRHNGEHGAAGEAGGADAHAAGAVEPPRRLDRKQIEERLEEDRERHKRLRESMWAIPKGADAEMWRLWEETSDLGEDDHLMGEEEQAEREQVLMASCVHRAEAARVGASPAVNGGASV